MKVQKTNAARILDAKHIDYIFHSYEHNDKDPVDGVTVAGKLGLPVEQVFKTLVARGSRTGINVFCIPVCSELDLKKAAKVAGDKDMAMVPVKDLLGLTGYIRGGCSPVGMKKRYPTFFDETCEIFDEIAVSAGERGHQMIVPPSELIALIGAEILDIIV
jgi:Cys-tRNA(Pro)/Cys-tRNA(Cys) deacylase